ncbi:MAG: hypothetical protein ACREQB_12190 [Candidatus Binataceae bacterium]
MKAHIVALALAIALGATAQELFAHDHSSADSGGDSTQSATGSMSGKLAENNHMTMTPPRQVAPADVERGNEILRVMRDQLSKYRDSQLAIADAYIPFMPTIPQDVFHFSSREITTAEYLGDFDLVRPGSLLYKKKTFGGYELIGAMYSAPMNATPEQLDKLIPLSLSQWHAHTSICLPQGVTLQDTMNGVMPMRPDIHSTGNAARGGVRARFGYLADGRFGFAGTIASEPECNAVSGSFHHQIFGWMVHVYPFSGDDFKVAFGHAVP